MPTSVQSKARKFIKDFLTTHTKTSEHIATDIYRALRDEANLLFERQKIVDAFDSDVFECFKGKGNDAIQEQIQRIKSIINVHSCSRSTSLSGSSEIECIVEFTKDDLMSDEVQNNVRLFFDYKRLPTFYKQKEIMEGFSNQDKRNKENDNDMSNEPDMKPKEKQRKEPPKVDNNDTQNDSQKLEDHHHHKHHSSKKRRRNDDDISLEHIPQNERSYTNDLCDDSPFQGTNVMYTIEVSYDYGPKQQLLIAEVVSMNDRPSIEPPIPMEDDFFFEATEKDNNYDNKEQTKEKHGLDESLFMDQVASDDVSDDDKKEQELNHKIASATTTTTTTTTATTTPDRYAAFLDPEELVHFLNLTQIELDEVSSVYFLLSFPFYENEWDIVDIILNSLFGTEDEHCNESNDDNDDEEEDKEDTE